ncbi:MAG: PAS domain S-box protein [Candidatus Thorarchaeota archaeon]
MDRLAELVDSMTSPAFVVDAEMLIERHNRALTEWLDGYISDDDIDGHTAPEVLPFMSAYLGLCSAAVIERSARYRHIEAILSGKRQLMTLAVLPVTHDDHQPHALVVLCREPRSTLTIDESEPLLSMVLSSIQDGVSFLDTNLNIVAVNWKMEEWYKHHMPVVGKKCHVVYQNRDKPCTFCPSLKALREGRPAYAGVPLTDSENTTVGWLDLYSAPMRDPSTDEIVGVLEYVRDATPQWLAENELRRSQGELRAMLDTMVDGVLVLDMEGSVVSCNPSASKILGYPIEEIVGRRLEKFFDHSRMEPGDSPLSQQVLLESETRVTSDVPFLRRDGTTIYAIMSSVVQRRESGLPSKVVVVLHDISMQRAMMEQLREEREKYHTLFESAPIAIGLFNSNGEALEMNLHLLNLLGCDPEAREGFRLQEMGISNWSRIIERTDRTGKLRDYSLSLKTRTGARIDAIISIDRVEIGGTPVYLTTIRDVTERNRTRRELEHARARAVLLNDLLSHDLQNIHQALLLGLELLQDSFRPTSEQQWILESVMDQVRRGIELTSNVRRLSSVEDSARADKTYDLEEVVNRAIDAVMQAFPSKTIHLVRRHDEQISVMGDEFLFDLFYNLVHNSVKHSRRPDVSIFIDVEEDPADDDMLIVKVADDGPGIPDAVREQIMGVNPPELAARHGMGLTLVKRIAERYGGGLSVEDRVHDQPGQGACFVVRLPRCNTQR